MCVSYSADLTIPLQITLSQFRLSGFVILVFSKQKGITVVFRNDPLESLKVSSTFDSIPFVRDFLQKEIEGQLRSLIMDELPLIIHRLSLRLCVPEYKQMLERSVEESPSGATNICLQNPFLDPATDSVDSSEANGSSSYESSYEVRPLFSQKNLIALAAMSNSQRTLSPFTPSMRDVVFRACASPEQNDSYNSISTPGMSRCSSNLSSISDTATQHSLSTVSSSGRVPSVSSFGGFNGLSVGSSRHSKAHPAKKRKRRVVNLRSPQNVEAESEKKDVGDSATSPSEAMHSIPEEARDDLITPPETPSPLKPAFTKEHHTEGSRKSSASKGRGYETIPIPPETEKSTASSNRDYRSSNLYNSNNGLNSYLPDRRDISCYPPRRLFGSGGGTPLENSQPFFSHPGILEQALMLKIASEFSRRFEDAKVSLSSADSTRWGDGWRRRDETPPPAYEPPA